MYYFLLCCCMLRSQPLYCHPCFSFPVPAPPALTGHSAPIVLITASIARCVLVWFGLVCIIRSADAFKVSAFSMASSESFCLYCTVLLGFGLYDLTGLLQMQKSHWYHFIILPIKFLCALKNCISGPWKTSKLASVVSISSDCKCSQLILEYTVLCIWSSDVLYSIFPRPLDNKPEPIMFSYYSIGCGHLTHLKRSYSLKLLRIVSVKKRWSRYAYLVYEFYLG